MRQRFEMGHQWVKQSARRAALEAQTALRRERAEQTRKHEAHTLVVLMALAERDAAVAGAELRAGAALLAMTQDGLSLRQAAEWCGDVLSVREATRLRRLAGTAASVQTAGPTGLGRVDDAAVTVRVTARSG